MANTLVLKRSAVPNKVPLAANLSVGELAINTNDGRLYSKISVNNVESVVDLVEHNLIGDNPEHVVKYSELGAMAFSDMPSLPDNERPIVPLTSPTVQDVINSLLYLRLIKQQD